MPLLQLRFGGGLYDSNTGGIRTEEWSCAISLSQTGTLDLDALLDSAATLTIQWFQTPAAGIDKTAALEFVSLNEIDIATGHQITDPTKEHIYSPSSYRGGRTPSVRQATFLSAKISIDDRTRSQRHKGGFYPPRIAFEPQATGRFAGTDVGGMVATAQTFINGLSALPGCNVVVWSRADKAMHGVTRVRVGDVPDYISRRKRQLVEQYQELPITP